MIAVAFEMVVVSGIYQLFCNGPACESRTNVSRKLIYIYR